MSVTVAEPAAAPARIPGGVQIAPSILAADYARLGQQLDETLAAGARVIHVDVMDGHFVPPITIGPVVVASIADRIHAAGGIVDVHLMIERPERQIDEFARAGADLITIHAEATPNVHYALSAIHAAGCLAGLAINPATSPEAVTGVIDLLDLALNMTVNPGWGGQRFIPSTRTKIGRLRELLPADCTIEVDGGIDRKTAPPCVRLGAAVLVAGSAIFGQPDPAEAYREIADAAAAGART